MLYLIPVLIAALSGLTARILSKLLVVSVFFCGMNMLHIFIGEWPHDGVKKHLMLGFFRSWSA